MSWFFQSNDQEKQELLEAVDNYPDDATDTEHEEFMCQVRDIAEPVNIDQDKLAEMLGLLLRAHNVDRARKLIDASISKERLGRGPRQFLSVLVFPFLFVVGLAIIICRVPIRWGKRFLESI